MVLGGLAMLRACCRPPSSPRSAAAGSRSGAGGLIVTVADIGMFNIGAAFWGLVAGFGVSWLMEKHDFTALANRAWAAAAGLPPTCIPVRRAPPGGRRPPP